MKDTEKYGKLFEEKEPEKEAAFKSTDAKDTVRSAEQQIGVNQQLFADSLERATEEEKQRWQALRGIDLAALSEQEQAQMLQIGRKILDELDEDIAAHPDAAAEAAERVLFLARSYKDRWEALETLIIAASKKGLTEINNSTNKRTLKGMVGKVDIEKRQISDAKGNIPEPGHPFKRGFCRVVAVLLALAVAAMFLVPGVSALLTDDLMETVVMAMGVIVMVASYFLVGFWGAAGIMVVFALLVVGGTSIMPMALFGKLLVTLVAVVIVFFCLRAARRESTKLTSEAVQRRKDAVETVRRDAERGYRYADTLVKQIDRFLKEDKPLQAGREEKSKSHHEALYSYIEQYSKRVQTVRIGMDDCRNAK